MTENNILAAQIVLDLAHTIRKENPSEAPDLLGQLIKLLLAILHRNAHFPPPELEDQQESFKKAYSGVMELAERFLGQQPTAREKFNQALKDWGMNDGRKEA